MNYKNWNDFPKLILCIGKYRTSEYVRRMEITKRYGEKKIFNIKDIMDVTIYLSVIVSPPPLSLGRQGISSLLFIVLLFCSNIHIILLSTFTTHLSNLNTNQWNCHQIFLKPTSILIFISFRLGISCNSLHSLQFKSNFTYIKTGQSNLNEFQLVVSTAN